MARSKNYKKFISATMATTVMASSVAAVLPGNTLNVEAASFTDIESGTYYYEAVLHLTEKGAIKGYEDGTFRPYQAITRGQAASILAQALQLEVENVKNPGFVDVTTDYRFYSAIAALVKAGIVQGVTKDTFAPEKGITRAEMAKMISHAFQLKDKQDSKTTFTDVPENSWYGEFVEALYDNGVTEGKTKSTFAPHDPVSRAQLATFIFRAQQSQQENKEDESTNPDTTPAPGPSTGGGSGGGGVPTTPAPDQTVANAVIEKITALPAVDALSLSDETAVNEAKTAWNALTPSQRELVSTELQTKLIEVIAKINELSDQFIPEGYVLKDDGKTAKVTTNEAFNYAVGQSGVEKIEITAGFTSNFRGIIKQEIIIPEEIEKETINFNHSIVQNLSVYGDDITIENATIHNLLIADTVYDLTLLNVKDAEESMHTFDGGGDQSIVLIGNTTFKGDIKITSGSAIQVRAESEDAAINGTVWIESEANTIISAPVTNVIIDKGNENIQINSNIEQLIIRSDATIKYGDNAHIEKAVKRVGVTVVAEEGHPIEFTEILDNFELQRLLLTAENLREKAAIGDKEGNVTQEALDQLKSAMDQAQKIYDENTSVDEETQDMIDSEVSRLQASITEFRNNIVHVDRKELEYEWHRAQRLANQVTIGTQPGQYPAEDFQALQALIAEAEEMHEGYGYSQQEIDEKTAELQRFITYFLTTKVEDGKGEDSIIDGSITFTLQGEHFTNLPSVDVEIIAYRENMGSNTAQFSTPEKVQEENGYRINVTNIDVSLADTYYAVIKTNRYLFIEKLTKKELEGGTIKPLTTENHVLLQAEVPFSDETKEHNNLALNLTNDSGKGILSAYVSTGSYVPVGTYNIQYNTVGTDASYSLFKDNFTVSETNNKIQFTEEELALVTFEIEQSQPVNYKFDGAAPLYSLGDKYNVIYHPRMPEGITSLYLTKGEYESIRPIYSIEKGEEYWRIAFDIKSIDIQNNQTLKVDDKLKFDVEWKNSEFEGTSMDVNTPFDYYYDVSVKDSTGQEVDSIEKAALDEWENLIHTSEYVNGKITVKTADKEFSKVVDRFNFRNFTISDITNGEPISGEAEIIFSVEDSPIAIQPYSETITISSNDEGVPGSGENPDDQGAPKFVNEEMKVEDQSYSEWLTSAGISLDQYFEGENLQYEISVEREDLIRAELNGHTIELEPLFNQEEMDSYRLEPILVKVTAANEHGSLSEEFKIHFYPEATGLETHRIEAGNVIHWQDSRVSEVTGYKVYRGLNDHFENAELISDVISTGTESFIDKNPKPGENYYYFVRPILNGEVVQNGDHSSNIKEEMKSRLEGRLGSLKFALDDSPSMLAESVTYAEEELNRALEAGWTQAEIESFSGYANLLPAQEKLSSFVQLASPANLVTNGTKISWDPVDLATGYEVIIYQKNKLDDYRDVIFTIDEQVNETFLDLSNIEGLKSGKYQVRVIAIGEGDPQSISRLTPFSGTDITFGDKAADTQVNESEEKVTFSSTLTMEDAFIVENGFLRFCR
ncbi:S-layer homology domain-containing protein [Bacillus tuaregi]|uniref:S-layer homology domain-containing protein n=1 Tax=Bacillus tuaregi TaxID=1816695 RepID=UPI0008F83368|nr:S-layer homology domain-containing protein [Bacillus tuaregi]